MKTMRDLSLHFRRIRISLMVLLLVVAFPAASFADTAATATPNNGIQQPTGVGAETYTFSQSSGLWENNYYTWNPVSKETLPKKALEYTYNTVTGLWDTKVWEFHPNVNAYEQVTVSVSQPPSGAVTHGGPSAAPPASTSPASQPNVDAEIPATESVESIDKPVQSSSDINHQPAADPSPAVRVDSSGGIVVDQAQNVTLHNSLDSDAHSGNALIQGNYEAGNATSGDSSAAATVINVLQSSAGLGSGGVATFVKDIQGDVSGDFYIDPTAYLQASQATVHSQYVTINTETNGTIHNEIDLNAQSGNATIDDNTHAGSAQSGNASAVANILNLINSVVAANQSFVGVVNIYGNYTGNILVPTDSLNSLLASNADSPSVNLGQTANASQATTTTGSQTIENNIDLSAVSGAANQIDNTRTGNATTGNALTNVTILNLTGRQVNAANSLLVFVNVLGSWVGVIMDAPAGATSAALTGGDAVPGDAASETATEQKPATSGSSTTTTQNSKIINDIKAHAQSGDATVSRNFESGNATSGNATASANVANILNSTFSLSKWFGVLFINVFGNWIGNFGAGDPPVPTTPSTNAESGNMPSQPVMFSFAPTSSAGGGDGSGIGNLARVDTTLFDNSADFDAFTNQVSEVLAAHDIASGSARPSTPAGTVEALGMNLALVPLAIGLAGLLALGAERIHAVRRRAAL